MGGGVLGVEIVLSGAGKMNDGVRKCGSAEVLEILNGRSVGLGVAWLRECRNADRNWLKMVLVGREYNIVANRYV
jgi:hypothetical protein